MEEGELDVCFGELADAGLSTDEADMARVCSGISGYMGRLCRFVKGWVV
jgi:hypothetical protein